MLKKIYSRLTSSIWLYPLIISIFSLLIAIFIYYVDYGFAPVLKGFFPDFMKAEVNEARSIHSFVASAFITIMTFTFSTTMVVLTMYMSQLSPRVVENFLNSKNTMRSFSIFVGGVIYSLTSLLFTNSLLDGTMVISATISALYIVVAIVYFLLFIRNVATFIQLSNVIERLYREAKQNIDTYVEMILKYDIHKHNDFVRIQRIKRVIVKRSSYIQNVNYKEMRNLAESFNGCIVFKKSVGEFVYQDEVLADIHAEDASAIPQDIDSKVRGCYLLGEQRTENQDFNYSIQKIVEVALRAISPGINDPNTAIHCIRMISVILKELIRLESGYVFMDEGDDETGLVFEVFNLDRVLCNTFNQIIHYGAADVSVILAVVECLNACIIQAPTENQIGIFHYSEYIWQKVNINITSDFELQLVKKAIDNLRSNVDA